MKVIDLLNKIANGEIEDKRTFNIVFENGLQRSIYYDKDEGNCMNCLKNVSDDYSIYDDISFDTEIATIEEPQEHKIPEKLDIREEKNIKNNWKWKVYGKEHSYNISTPQKIIADKINEILDYLEEIE